MRFCTITLGCKANQYDTGTIESILRGRGHEQVRLGSGADVCIVNTCAVTAESVRKSGQAVRRVKNKESGALIAVCGCWTQMDNEATNTIGADLTGGTNDREEFADKVEELYNSQLIIHNCVPQITANCHCGLDPQSPEINMGFRVGAHSDKYIEGHNYELCIINSPRTRALLKIQDGCDNHCAYCIIPKARGHSYSIPLPVLAGKAQQLETQSYKEIVITGIEISSYKPNLIEAIQTIAKNAPSARIRLGSLDPSILTNQFINGLRQIPGICGHFHMSLQSGCDETLARMKRKYNTKQAADAIRKLRETFDNCGITADLITGFPGETDEQFRQTLAFIKQAEFSAMHIFPYSKRPGTAAAGMPHQVPGNIKKERAKQAASIEAQLGENFKNKQIGKTLEVLIETNKNNHGTGHSRNYLTVATPGKFEKNTLVNIKITSVQGGTLYGVVNEDLSLCSN